MDLNAIEGLNLTDEQKQAILAQNEADIAGLKNKNEELLNEKKTVQQSASEQALALEEARKLAVKAEEERLKANNDMEGLKAHYEEQLATATATANEEANKAKENLTAYHKANALNGALGLIHDDFKGVSNALLSNMINIDYNDQGEAVTSFTHEGQVVATNVEEFKSWASEQDAFKRILNGTDSSGASSGGNGSAGGANQDKDSAFKQRLRDAGLIKTQ